ncbi:MAG: sulfite exporter TauE/SafE family protein [Gammaproteobacteria bacterium]|nr:sulfite exporter TauE/SafE family protein [Gammaproteobacteria bacterium]
MPSSELPAVTALLMGLLGSAHCLGMCGGIVGAINTRVPRQECRGLSKQRHVGIWLAYNAGRIFSYGVAGGIAGYIGHHALELAPATGVVAVGGMVAGGFLIALGLYIAGWWHGLAALERIGGRLWQYLEPTGRRLIGRPGVGRALGIGAIWGWLPCGLVYSALAWAAVSGNPLTGTVIMLAFGLGTLPALLLAGTAARSLLGVLRGPRVRNAIGIVMIVAGAAAILGWSPFATHRDKTALAQRADTELDDKSGHLQSNFRHRWSYTPNAEDALK